MSDLLNNLALRSLGSAERVQPRLPSLFEKASFAAGSLFAPGFIFSEQTGEDFAETSEERDLETQPIPPGWYLSAPEYLTVRPRQDALNIQERTPAPAQGLAPLSPAAQPPMLASPHVAVISQPPGPISSAPLTPQGERAARLSVGANQAAVVDAASTPLRDAKPQPKLIVGTPAHAAHPQRLLPLAPVTFQPVRQERAADDFASAKLPAVLHRLIEAHSAYKPPVAAPRPAASSEPTIQVTIGRIEVRAAPQPATSPQRQVASPVTTLEEYLRSRSQRGGR